MRLEEFDLQGTKIIRKDVEEKREIGIKEFINQLKCFINENKEVENKMNLCVVKDRENERLTLVDVSNGKEFNIFIAKSENDIRKLNAREIFDKIYYISEKAFYNLDLGSNIVLKRKRCEIYNGDIRIDNNKARLKLEELYFNLKEEEGQIFKVDKIDNEKIYLKGENGGYFSIYKQVYPELKKGDMLKKENKKYIKYKSVDNIEEV